jgi:hypothetical protein
MGAILAMLIVTPVVRQPVLLTSTPVRVWIQQTVQPDPSPTPVRINSGDGSRK